ncbi:hypothetical protein PIB30_090956, partial [Stylosanthes scabra]|nr:hypothetical protein [Stylosanthes scabra]
SSHTDGNAVSDHVASPRPPQHGMSQVPGAIPVSTNANVVQPLAMEANASSDNIVAQPSATEAHASSDTVVAQPLNTEANASLMRILQS